MKTVAFSTIEHSKYKYQLDEMHEHLTRNYEPIAQNIGVKGNWVGMLRSGVLIFRPGYMWDGPSGPALDTVNMLRASLVHDGIYQLIADGLLPKAPWKKLADREFHAVMRQDCVPGWRALYAYYAVRIFGNARDKYRP